ncbi:MAG: alpha/beta hydrolase [Candidatus Omnitrophica bacterium]|nr:alpha/beta hydrolase [Candidatus Omnitrophota bacterium]
MKYNFIDKGKGRPIIMLHGIFGHASNWKDIIEPLSKGYRTLALELPYLELKKDDCNIAYLSEYVSKFADSHGFNKAIYMGNSLGGHIALDIATRDHERVEALILTGSSGLFERGYENDLQIHPTKTYLYKKIGEIFFDKSHVTEELIDDVYNILLNRKNKINIIRLSKSAKSYNIKDQLKFVDCPTILIWGKQDPITPPSAALEFEQSIKKAELKFIDNCCHAPMIEHPGKFGKLALEFLSTRL